MDSASAAKKECAPADCGWATVRRRLPARAGDDADEVETPCLIVSRQEFDANLDRCASRARMGGNICLRPHIKSHKSSAIAEMQCLRSPDVVCGVTCQKVCEVEAMVPAMLRAAARLRTHTPSAKPTADSKPQDAAAGFESESEAARAPSRGRPAGPAQQRFTVLLSNQCVGPRKIARLVAAAKEGVATERAALGGAEAGAGPGSGFLGEPLVSVVFDNEENAREVSKAAAAAGVELGALVEVGTAQRRCGVRTPAQAAGLAALLEGLPGLVFLGVQAYQGALQHVRSVPERARAVGAAASAARAAVAAIEARLGRAGACAVVTGGGTGSLQLDVQEGAWNELQPGSYAFSDADYARNLASDGRPDGGRVWAHALFLACTVMSRTGDPGNKEEGRRPQGRVVLDVGLKATSLDSGAPELWSVRGWAGDDPRVGRLREGTVQLSDEHCQLFAPPMGEEEEADIRRGAARGAAGGDAAAGEGEGEGEEGDSAVEEALLAGLPDVGQVVWMVPGHVDPTFNHHDFAVVVKPGALPGVGKAAGDAGAGEAARVAKPKTGGVPADGRVPMVVEQVLEINARSPGY